MSTKEAHRVSRRRPHETTPAMEWALGTIGAALFLLALGFLILEGVRGDDRPGEITIRVDEILPAGNTYVVRYSAHNRGSQTLADVHLTARLFDGDAEVEKTQAVLNFLPGDSTRRGGFYLHEDPRRYRLEIRPEGYREP